MSDPCYSYKVWGKDLIPFLTLTGATVWRTRVNGKRWLYSYYGYYLDPKCKRAKTDKLMLERSGFRKVEMVEML